MLYKYPQVAFPYDDLVEQNLRRSKLDPEYELIDALKEAFEQNRYFDVYIEYAKADQEDLLCRITAINRADAPADLHILPHIWFRNSWSWGHSTDKPLLEDRSTNHLSCIRATHKHLGERWWYAQSEDAPTGQLLFTENETNYERLFNTKSASRYVKDGIHRAVVNGEANAVHGSKGTKAAAHFQATIPAGASYTVMFRFAPQPLADPFGNFTSVMETRIDEANAFYHAVQNPKLTPDEQNVQRQAFAGLMWTKQFYHYSLEKWLEGDPLGPKPPESRKHGRNHDWRHLYNLDVISMPDKWEYPWYAAWDLAFHMIPIAMIDPEWAKRQLILDDTRVVHASQRAVAGIRMGLQ